MTFAKELRDSVNYDDAPAFVLEYVTRNAMKDMLDIAPEARDALFEVDTEEGAIFLKTYALFLAEEAELVQVEAGA